MLTFIQNKNVLKKNFIPKFFTYWIRFWATFSCCQSHQSIRIKDETVDRIRRTNASLLVKLSWANDSNDLNSSLNKPGLRLRHKFLFQERRVRFSVHQKFQLLSFEFYFQAWPTAKRVNFEGFDVIVLQLFYVVKVFKRSSVDDEDLQAREEFVEPFGNCSNEILQRLLCSYQLNADRR